MKQKTFFTLLKLVLGVIILALVFVKIGWKDIVLALSHTSWLSFFFAFLLFLLSVVIAAVNIKIILDPFFKIPFPSVLNYFLISNRIASLFLPGRIGEYSIVFLFKKRYAVPLGISSAAVTMDKLITLAVSGLIAFAGFFYFFNLSFALQSLYVLLALFVVLGVLLMPFSRNFIKKYILRKYAAHLVGFSATIFSYYKNNRTALACDFILTIVRSVIIALSAYFMFAALGVYPPLLFIIGIGGIETVSTLLPITINGLGVKQSIGIYLYTLIGVDPAVSAARYVLGFIINYGFALLSLIIIKNPVRDDEAAH